MESQTKQTCSDICGRKRAKIINHHLQMKALKMIQTDNQLSSEFLFNKDRSVTVMYDALRDLVPFAQF